MSRDEAQKLLGGYATGTLTPEEQQALFEAALEDQSLFDQLAKEQPLHELLADRSVRAQLLASLDERPEPWYRRWASWGLPAAATAVIVAGLLVWRVNQKEARPLQVAQVLQPAATPAEPAPNPALPEPAAAAPRPAAPASAPTNEREAPANPATRPQAGKPRAVGSLDSELKTANQPLGGEKDKAAATAADSLKLRDAKTESARRADSAPGAVSGSAGGVVGGIVGGVPGGLLSAAPPPPPPPQQKAVAAPAAPRASAMTGAALGGRATGALNGFLPASSTFAGVVKDAAGAALPGADVKIFTNDGDTPVASAKTGSRGEFVTPLSAGVYRLQVLAPGFQSYNGDVTFDGALTTPLPITLRVGATTETVMVTAQAGAAGAQQAGSQQAVLQQTPDARQGAQFGAQLAQVQTGAAGRFIATTVKILRKQPDGSLAEAKPDDLHVGDSVTFEITPNSAGLLTLTENSSTPPLVNRAPVQAGKPFDAPAIVLAASGVRQFAAQIEPGAGRGGGGGGGRGGAAGFGSARGGLAKSAKKQEPEAADAVSTAPILIRITVR